MYQPALQRLASSQFEGDTRLVIKNTFFELVHAGSASPYSGSKRRARTHSPGRKHTQGKTRYYTVNKISFNSTHSPRSSIPSKQSRSINDTAKKCLDVGLYGTHTLLSQSKRHQLPTCTDKRTTVMLRHIPDNYTREMLIKTIDSQKFKGTYDYVYMPIDFSTNCGQGYAFVNFVDSEAARAFWNAFNGFNKWTIPTSKIGCVAWSTLQGLESQINWLQKSSIMRRRLPDEWKPIFFENGDPIEFKVIRTRKPTF